MGCHTRESWDAVLDLNTHKRSPNNRTYRAQCCDPSNRLTSKRRMLQEAGEGGNGGQVSVSSHFCPFHPFNCHNFSTWDLPISSKNYNWFPCRCTAVSCHVIVCQSCNDERDYFIDLHVFDNFTPQNAQRRQLAHIMSTAYLPISVFLTNALLYSDRALKNPSCNLSNVG